MGFFLEMDKIMRRMCVYETKIFWLNLFLNFLYFPFWFLESGRLEDARR